METKRKNAIGILGTWSAVLCTVFSLAWSLAQPYLFVTSIFPIAAPWAGITLLFGALVLALSALLPCADHNPSSTPPKI